ncbi:dehydrogenase E1 component subunit alpha/beta [Paucibacter sp. Y2R2-4]|uniref:dehydrogenase E1 component subunit alpha/beta n=1 Tax=Paucibacter sp. Y2R2-4 TaxID=2893553 RepID=UPI0021E494A5|nr:alpha-ketoacid dehydrogenase subunit alpha/beta [Paucibacter sp. Y2R2-4]MCV2348548.1 2-oxoglutarate dehydrogenase [Paucibacter sp. Y2R2-4]
MKNVSTADLPFELDAHGKPKIALDLADSYSYGQLLRQTETTLLDLFGRGLLSGTTHTCLGQELCQMSVVRALDHADDVVLSNHRNHGHFLTYSGNVTGLLAEVMGREAGVCGGYGGSQHMAYRHFHSNGVQAGMTGIGVGLAMALQQRGSQGLVTVMIGDGTLGEGLLYESMNLAAIWKLPVLFVVENNGIAQTTETSYSLGGSILARGQAFGLRSWELDDAAPDFLAQAEAVVKSMRASPGAGFLCINTQRLGPHSKGDDLRPEELKQQIARRDPLMALRRQLDEAQADQLDASIKAHVAASEALAMASPEAQFESLREHCLREPVASTAPMQAAKQPNVRTAINLALRDLLQHDPRVVVLGEDLHEPYGGAFKVTAGLSSAFEGRVLSTPISEAGITGAGIGLALAGMRPVVEIMFADFLTLTVDQLYNHAVKFPGMFPDTEVPIVVRAPAGGRRGYGPTHSQSPENILVSIPGLSVVYGSHRHNVGQLLVNAVTAWPNPTVFMEHKLLYSEAQDPKDYVELPAHSADPGAVLFPTLQRASGDTPDVTLLSFGGMLPHVERAAARLEAEEELQVEIIAPSLLAPWPRHTLLPLLLERDCILVVEESHHEYGVSAELLASLAEAGYKGTVGRLGLPPVPIAAARSLEFAQMIDDATIVASVLDLL